MKKVKVGDVLMSVLFAQGDRDSSGILYVGASGNADKPERGMARYVVVHTELSGGGTGHGLHDVYPDGWCVQARLLTNEGQYNSRGELITFYQSGCFRCMVENPLVVGTMDIDAPELETFPITMADNNTWEVLKRGEEICIVDNLGRQRHRSNSYSNTATHLAMMLNSLPLPEEPNADQELRREVEKFRYRKTLS